jgi:5-methylcytosine-specific restriction endonuclease McrA
MKRGVPADIYLQVLKRDNFTCRYCGLVGDTLEKWALLQIDHFIPRSKGGSNNPENLVTGCYVCNGIKSGKVFKDKQEAKEFIKKEWDSMRPVYESQVKGK